MSEDLKSPIFFQLVTTAVTFDADADDRYVEGMY